MHLRKNIRDFLANVPAGLSFINICLRDNLLDTALCEAAAGSCEEEAGGVREAPGCWRVQAAEDDVRLLLPSNVLAVRRYVKLASCDPGQS